MAKGHELEIDIDARFEDREARARTAGRIAVLLLVVVAAVGLAGGGGLLPAARATSGGLGVSYERVARQSRQEEMEVELGPGTEGRLWLSPSLLEGMAIQEITPEPAGMESEAGRTIWRFDGRPSRLRIRYEPVRAGMLEGELGAGAARVRISQLVWF